MAIEDFDQVTIAPAKLTPFSKFIMSIGELPTSYLDSLSYAEQVTWFCDYLQNNVIPAINNNADALEEVQALIVELKEYVDQYFSDTNLQPLINNKLDEMAEDGTLENIISGYIDNDLLIVVNNVAEMKNLNLIENQKVKTLGYYTANDGGAGLYKIRSITNNDVIDNGSIIEINENLIAELIIKNNTVSSKQFGAIGNGINDDTSNLQALFNFAKNHTPITIYINGLHYITNTLLIAGTNENKVSGITITGINSTRGYAYVDTVKYGFIFNATYDFSSKKGCIQINYGSGINIENLKITTNETVENGEIPLNADYGIYLLYNSNTTIKNCNITNFFNGIFSNGSGLAYIKENNISLCNIGIRLAENGDSTIENNYINTIGSGIYDLNGVLKSKYSALYSSNNLFAMGMYIGGSGNMTVKGGKIEWCAIGIWQDYTTNMIYDTIQFDRCNVCGIGITGHNSIINRTSVLNSNFTGCGGTTLNSSNADRHIGGLDACCIGANQSMGLLISNNKFFGDNGTLKGSFNSGNAYYGPLFVLKFTRVSYSSFINNIVEVDNNYAYVLTNTELEFNNNISNKFMSVGANTLIYRQAGLKREFFHYNPTILTFGNFDLNDIIYDQNNLTNKWRVTTAGTAETINTPVSVVTVATDYYPANKTIDIGTSLVNGVRTGAYISIAGVTGTKKIISILKNENKFYALLDSDCDVAVINATMSNVSPVFTQIN